MTTQPWRGQHGNLWTCDVCGKRALWVEGWLWYGSLEDAEKGRWSKITVTCSEECASKAEVKK